MFTQHFLSCCMMSLLIWLNIFGATYLLNIFPVIPDFPGTPGTVNLWRSAKPHHRGTTSGKPCYSEIFPHTINATL